MAGHDIGEAPGLAFESGFAGLQMGMIPINYTRPRIQGARSHTPRRRARLAVLQRNNP